MPFRAEKRLLFVLAITAVAFSRAVFALFDDPEGPNLVVVIGLAAVIYLPSLLVDFFALARSGRLLVAILIQLVVAAGLYLVLR